MQALTHFKVAAYQDIFERVGDTVVEAIERQHEYWQSPICKKYGGIRGGIAPSISPSSFSSSGSSIDIYGWFRQFMLLSQRYMAVLIKDHLNLGILLAQAPILVIIILLVFPSDSFEAVMKSDATSHLRYANPVTFLLAIIAIWFGTSNSVREIVKEAPITIRERLAFLRPSAYLCSKFVVLAGLCLLQCLIMIIGVGLWTEGFHIDSNAQTALLGVMFLTSLAGLGLGLTLSTLARSSDQAVSLTPLVLVPQIVFSGLFLPENSGNLVTMLAKLHIAYWSYSSLGTIIDINGKINSLPKSILLINDCFEGDAEPKVLALFMLFMLFSVISLAAVHTKRRR